MNSHAAAKTMRVLLVNPRSAKTTAAKPATENAGCAHLAYSSGFMSSASENHALTAKNPGQLL
jgi:hypothetical protein